MEWSSGENTGEARRTLGAFYTPEWAVEYMVGMVDDLPSRACILEPSGGDGAFVSGLLDAGVPSSSIHVWDVNPDVKNTLENLGVDATIQDSLLTEDASTFDLVLGNPPYLNKASDYIRSNRKALTRRYASVGVNDTYGLFLYEFTRRLNPDGQLIFLVSDTFLTLGIHRKLREYLLSNARIDQVILLPEGTFADASVHTAVIKLTRTVPADDHEVVFVDARTLTAPSVEGDSYTVAQAELASRPGSVFAFSGEDRYCLDLVASLPPLVSLLDGGLGMHTTDNARYLRKLTNNAPVPPGFRPYHKKGGARAWFAPLDHAVDASPDALERYGVPATALACVDDVGNPRRGFVLSGVSARLSARTMVRGAWWESNKVFGFFPKDSNRYPVEFFLAVLNSSLYARVARALNHTVSLQVRDVNSLPLLPFTETEVAQLASLGFEATAAVRDGGRCPQRVQDRIDELVGTAASRVLGNTR